MPKKFVGENSKAAEARARKEAVRKDHQLKKQQEIDDAYWKDDDKHVTKKLQRKEDKEKKRQEQLEKKQTNKLILESEMSSIKSVKQEPTKLTRTQIISQLENEKKSVPSESKSVPTITEQPLIENLNYLQIDGEEARTVDEALQLLGSKEKAVDMHPEKRLKAAFATFEANNLDRLKKEYPTLRLSQLKQMLRKEWMKSPENPLNNL